MTEVLDPGGCYTVAYHGGLVTQVEVVTEF